MQTFFSHHHEFVTITTTDIEMQIKNHLENGWFVEAAVPLRFVQNRDRLHVLDGYEWLVTFRREKRH